MQMKTLNLKSFNCLGSLSSEVEDQDQNMDLDSNTIILFPHDKQSEFSSESIMSFTTRQTKWRFSYFDESISGGKVVAGTIYGEHKRYRFFVSYLTFYSVLLFRGGSASSHLELDVFYTQRLQKA